MPATKAGPEMLIIDRIYDLVLPVPKFPDPPGMENRVHFSYA